MLRTEIAQGRSIFEGQALLELPTASRAPLASVSIASAKRSRSA